MIVINSVSEMQKIVDELRKKRQRIGLVPTMGYLHNGHLSLIQEAKKYCSLIIVSIFVNPTQFAPNEDLQSYPCDLEKDKKLAESAGCDIIFNPTPEEMYPDNYLTYVEVEDITTLLCGKSRPSHFKGVTSVVCKLFNICKPHIAVFGQKDAQQSIVIKRMVNDLNFDVDIIVAPIIRESDGLAMSSRNAYLEQHQRAQATVLYKALMLAQQLIGQGERCSRIIRSSMQELIDKQPDAKIDYIEIVNTTTLESRTNISEETLIALAVKIGRTRLIDNIIMKID